MPGPGRRLANEGRDSVVIGTSTGRHRASLTGLSTATLKPVAHTTSVRGKYWWVRWALLGVAVIVLAVEATLVWDQLAKAWQSLLSANLW